MNYFNEVRTRVEAAKGANAGLSAQDIAFVIGQAPSEHRKAVLAIVNGTGGPEARRDALAGFLEDIEDAETGAREQAEREAEVRALSARTPALFAQTRSDADGADEWRGVLPAMSEYRALIAESSPGAGGYAVPTTVAGRYVDLLRNASVGMRAPGVNVITSDSQTFRLPALQAATVAGVTAEGAQITEGTDVWAALDFKAVKYADLRRASSEVLADAAFDLRAAIGNTMVRGVASKVDADFFAGPGGANGLTGLVGQGNETVLSAGETVVSWDSVIDAYCAIEAIGGAPSVIWASPEAAKALRKERSQTDGAYMTGSVTDNVAKAALGLPILVSGNVPAGKAVVADGTRVWVAVRSDVSVKVSEDAGFTTDTVLFRVTYRVGGVSVDTENAVQVITPAAA